MPSPKGNKASPNQGVPQPLLFVCCTLQTKPDLCYSASVLARFTANPGDAHFEQAQHLLRYLSDMPAYRPRIGGSGAIYDKLAVWGDVVWVHCPETRRDVSGHVVQFHGATVHCRWCKHSSVAKSAMIAGFNAAYSAADECIYFAHLLCVLGYELGSSPLLSDSGSHSTI
jgi:hypothetical protein